MEELIGAFVQAVIAVTRFFIWLFWEALSEYFIQLVLHLIMSLARLIAKLGRFICQGVINLTQALRSSRSIE